MDLLAEYPEAELIFVYSGDRRFYEGGIEIVPAEMFLREMEEFIYGVSAFFLYVIPSWHTTIAGYDMSCGRIYNKNYSDNV